MMFWKHVLCPKTPLSIAETANIAIVAGMPMFQHGGKLFNVNYHDKDGPAFTDSGMVPEQFDQPDVYCVMDAKREKVATARDGTGPMLFLNPAIAMLLAEKYGGEAELLFAAIWKQKQAQENAPRIITPDNDTILIPE